MGTLPAVHFVADLTLRVIHQNLALAAFDEHHKTSHSSNQYNDDQRNHWMHGACVYKRYQTTQCIRQTSGDTSKNNDRNPIAQTTFGDLLTQPHQKQGARHQSCHCGNAEYHARIKHQARL